VGLESEPVLPPADEVDGASAEQAAEQAQRKAFEVVLLSKWRKPIAGANLLASILLVIAAVTLLRRRPTAIWWTTQAGIANALYSLAEAGTQAASLQERWGEIVAIAPAHRAVGEAAASDVARVVIAVLVVRLVLYTAIVWRARRPDVRAALAA
jgi:hypothetical protein